MIRLEGVTKRFRSAAGERVALDAVDLVAVVQNGKIVSFGPKDEVLGVRAVPSIDPAAEGQPSAKRRAASAQAV